MFLWDAKGSELYMCPLIQQLRAKGIDGCLQMDPSTDLGMFTTECMPPAFVTQDIVNSAP